MVKMFNARWRKEIFEELLKIGSPTFTRASWISGIILGAAWIYESERRSPWIFSEKPEVFKTPQASEFTMDDHLEWNNAIQDKNKMQEAIELEKERVRRAQEGPVPTPKRKKMDTH